MRAGDFLYRMLAPLGRRLYSTGMLPEERITRMKYVLTALVTSALTLGILAVAHRTAMGRRLLGF